MAELDRAQAKYTQERKERSQRELRAAMPGRLSRFGAEHIDRLRIAVHDAKSCGVDQVEVDTAEIALMTAKIRRMATLREARRDRLACCEAPT